MINVPLKGLHPSDSYLSSMPKACELHYCAARPFIEVSRLIAATAMGSVQGIKDSYGLLCKHTSSGMFGAILAAGVGSGKPDAVPSSLFNKYISNPLKNYLQGEEYSCYAHEILQYVDRNMVNATPEENFYASIYTSAAIDLVICEYPEAKTQGEKAAKKVESLAKNWGLASEKAKYSPTLAKLLASNAARISSMLTLGALIEGVRYSLNTEVYSNVGLNEYLSGHIIEPAKETVETITGVLEGAFVFIQEWAQSKEARLAISC